VWLNGLRWERSAQSRISRYNVRQHSWQTRNVYKTLRHRPLPPPTVTSAGLQWRHDERSQTPHQVPCRPSESDRSIGRFPGDVGGPASNSSLRDRPPAGLLLIPTWTTDRSIDMFRLSPGRIRRRYRFIEKSMRASFSSRICISVCVCVCVCVCYWPLVHTAT